EPDGRMQEQRVEAGVGRLLGHRARRREGNAVRRPLDEGLEGVAAVERRAEHALALLALVGAVLLHGRTLAARGRCDRHCGCRQRLAARLALRRLLVIDVATALLR